MINEKFDKRITILVPQGLHDEFIDKCKKNYKRMSDILRELMIDWVKNNDKKIHN